MDVRRWLCFVVVLALPWNLLSLVYDFNTMKKFSIDLDRELEAFLDEATGKKDLEKAYEDNKGDVTFKNINAIELLDSMAEKLGYEILGKKREALLNSVKFAEKIASNYKYESTLRKATGFDVDTMYVNTKTVNESDENLQFSDKFQQDVSLEWSTVHVPVEIYDGDLEIMNGLNWTSQLDSVYKENLAADPDLLWQYFGSQRGFIRSYPGTKWREHAGVDLYDVRRRPWYTQGSSSPKDMFILLDTSGSMHGQGMQLMKVTVKVLLDTLGENDFVAIANFSNNVTYISCLNTFVQANHKNKMVFSENVDRLEAHGMAFYSKGLDFALEEFKAFDKHGADGRGASCNKVIMLITDGGEDFAAEVLEKHKEFLKDVRIFTYAIGQGAGPVEAAKYFACNYRGYYSPITGMGAIRSKVQTHADALTRFFAKSGFQQFQWSEIYYDRWGLGMMTTLTLPVYNRSTHSSNQTILGVMGVDVTTKDMTAQTPKREIGIRGYAFAINANGFIVFHPNLKGQHGYLNDPPNVDLVEVEWDNAEKRQLRKNMINNGTGIQEIETFVLYNAERYARKENITYHYRGIPDTLFSIGFAIPKSVKKYLKVKTPYNGGVDSLLSEASDTILAPWNYCRNSSIGNLGKPNDVDEVIQQIKSKDPACQNSTDLIMSLLWDSAVTAGLDTKWAEADVKLGDSIPIRMLQTVYGGLTRIYPSSNKTNTYDGLRTSEMWDHDMIQSADSFDGYHLRAPYTNGPYNMSAQIDPNVTLHIHDITVSTAVKYKQEDITTAVITVQLSSNKLHDFLTNLTNSHADICNDPESVDCYLIDEGAFVVSTNQDLQSIGRFLGRVDSSLMTALYNDSVFKRETAWDHQAACPPEVAPINSAGARGASLPILYEALNLNWWTASASWAWMNFNLYNLFSNPSNYVAAELGTDAFTNRSCINETFQYYYNLDDSSFSNTLTCVDCSRSYSIFRLVSSNLFLLVADREDLCDTCLQIPLPQEPKISNGPDMCVEPHRYRKRPTQCYSRADDEDYSDCGGSSNIVPSMSLLLFLIVAKFI